MRDWLAALEWVQENIAAFGGDPRRVTIAGQSAGGGAVLTLLGMPAAQHLFHSAWALSAAHVDVSPERARTTAARLANLAGVTPDRAGFSSVPEVQLRELEEKAAASDSTDRIGTAIELLAGDLPWGPVLDGDLLARPTLDAIANGIGSDKPLVIGTTDDEFTMLTDAAGPVLRVVPPALALGRLALDRVTRRAYLAANAARRRLGTGPLLGRYVTDAVFRSTVVRTARARGDAPTWTYRFSWASPTKRWAVHCLDVPFWFDCLDADGVDVIAGDAPPRGLAASVHGSAAEFVRDGHPGWPAWSARPGTTRIFGGAASEPDIDPDGYASVAALVAR